MRMDPIDSSVWMLGSQLSELFGMNYEMWLCWRRCGPGDGLKGFKSSCHKTILSPSASWFLSQKVSSQLLLQQDACVFVAVLPAMKVMD